jgi:hypothetical protein
MKQDSQVSSRFRPRALLRPLITLALIAIALAAGWRLSLPLP